MIDIELLQYFQTETDIRINIEGKSLEICIYKRAVVDCSFRYEHKDIDDLLFKLNIKSFAFCPDIEIDEDISILLDTIRKFPIYIKDSEDEDDDYASVFESILKKYPNIKIVTDLPLSPNFKIDYAKVFKILSKYDGLNASVICNEIRGPMSGEAPRFEIEVRDKRENMYLQLPLFNDKLLEILIYNSFRITSHGENILNCLSKICEHYHKNEVKSIENKQICKKCKEKYNGIIQRYNSLFELMYKLKTEKRMLYLFPEELKGKNLAMIDEIRMDRFPGKTREHVELLVKLGFKGILKYYDGSCKTPETCSKASKVCIACELAQVLKMYNNSPIKFVKIDMETEIWI